MKALQNIRGEKMYVLADQVIVSGSAFATNLLLAKELGLEEYGHFSALIMLQLFLLSLSMGFGSQVYQVVFPSVGPARKRLYTSGLFYLQITACCLVFIFVIAAAFLLPGLFRSYYPVLVPAAAAIALYLLQDFIRKALLTRQMARHAFRADTLTNVLQLALLGIFAYGGILDTRAAWLVIGGTFIPSVIAGIFWLRPYRLSVRAMQYAWKLHKNKCGWLLGSSLLQWCSGYFFVAAAGWWIGAAALGALRLAQYIFGLLNVLLQAVENYVLPKAVLSNDPAGLARNLLKKCMLLIFPVLLLLSLFGRQVLELAGGKDYTSYTYVMYGLSIVYVLITIGYPVRIMIRSRHFNRQYFTGYILSICFSVPAAPWLLQQWQLYGVLAGLILTQLLTSGYWIFFLHKQKITLWK